MNLFLYCINNNIITIGIIYCVIIYFSNIVMYGYIHRVDAEIGKEDKTSQVK